MPSEGCGREPCSGCARIHTYGQALPCTLTGGLPPPSLPRGLWFVLRWFFRVFAAPGCSPPPPLRAARYADLLPGVTGAFSSEPSVKCNSSKYNVISLAGERGIFYGLWVFFPLHTLVVYFPPLLQPPMSIIRHGTETNFRAVPPNTFRRTLFLSSGRICASERKHPLGEMCVFIVLCAHSCYGSSFGYGYGRQLTDSGPPVFLLQPPLMSSKAC